nr:phage minor tail protein Z [uncultured Mediterranean phage uvMED]
MIKLDIKSELPQAAKWTNEHTKQLPFSIAQALTATSKGLAKIPESKTKNIIADYKRIVKSKLDRPTKGIQDGFFATTANKRTLRTQITPKGTYKGKGWDRGRYIAGNIKGGDRPNKWIEIEARRLGNIPSNLDLVPTKNVPRDDYGNPKRGFIKTKFRGVSSGKTFIGKPQQIARPYGIYDVSKRGNLKAYFVAVSSTSYPKPLVDLKAKAQARANNVFGKYLRMRLKANVADNVKRGKADLRTSLF